MPKHTSSRYAAELNGLCDGRVRTFRAGGYCVEPFQRLGPALCDNGVAVDSSVVPGIRIQDAEKGVDFSRVADTTWWRFGGLPARPDPDGEFLEIPFTPGVLPLWHYWGRAFDRLRGHQPASVMGDGATKAIGRREIPRRLAGLGRHSELSMDASKVAMLNNNGHRYRPVSHIMGHPKLFGQASLEALRTWIIRTEIRRFQTVSGVARAICAGEFSLSAPRG